MVRINNDTVIKKARELGFDLIGFARVRELDEEYNRLQEWLKSGYNAGMEYMERNGDKRKNAELIMEGAKSVISLGMNYNTPFEHEGGEGYGKVSRYAWGKDYHFLIWEKLDNLIRSLKEIDEKFEGKSYIDTGPVMDKAWAVKAGLGWMGKHTNIINRSQGSWFFIANIITSYDFDFYEQEADHCGSCTACIEACPTDAITKAYTVDANRCISYLTIENKGDIPAEFAGKFEDWIFGCDICQDVCPWNNKFSKVSEEKYFYPINENVQLNIEEMMNIGEEDFRKKFKESPLKRSKIKGIKRNAEFLKREG